jgi:hypothetical protein
MALSLAQCVPSIFDVNGGGTATLYGVFPASALSIYATLDGDTAQTQYPMLSGVPGSMAQIMPYSGFCTFVFGRVPVFGPYSLHAVNIATGESAIASFKLTANQPFFSSTVYSLRATYAPIWATGARDLDAEPFPWAGG